MTASGQWWLVPAIAAGALTFVALGIGVWQLLCGRNIEAANWVYGGWRLAAGGWRLAAGGLGLIVFSSVHLHREARREAERLAAARAKLKPVAWLARRMCEQAVIESGDRTMNQWLARWYTRVVFYMMQSDRPPDPLSVLQDLLRETVTLAADARDKDVKAADAAFDAFIAAANVTNHLQGTLGGGADTTVYQAAIPRGRRAAQHLATAGHALERLAPRGAEEPAVPVDPKFTDEK